MSTLRHCNYCDATLEVFNPDSVITNMYLHNTCSYSMKVFGLIYEIETHAADDCLDQEEDLPLQQLPSRKHEPTGSNP